MNHKSKVLNIDQLLFRKLAALLGMFMILFTISGGFLVIASNQEKHYAYIIGSASLQQTLQQQYVRDISIVISGHATSSWDTVFQHANSAKHIEELIDKTFKGFFEGGAINTSLDGTEVFSIKALQDKHLRALLQQAEKEWRELKHIATVTLQADVSSIVDNPRYDKLTRQVDISTKACEQFVNAIQRQGIEVREKLILYQLLTILSGILLLCAILAYIQQRVTAPLSKTTRALELMKLVSTISNEPGPLGYTLEKALQSICTLTPWSAANIHFWDNRKKLLIPSKLVFAESPEEQGVLQKLAGGSFSLGEGLPGQVAEAGKPIWLDNRSEVEELGGGILKSAFAFPISTDEGLVAVIELFSKDCLKPDSESYSMFNHVAGQLEHVLQRLQAEKQLRLKDRALDAASSGIVITDPNQNGHPIIYCNPTFEALTGYTSEEILQKSHTILAGENNEQATLDKLRVAFEQGQTCSVVLKNIRKNDQPFWSEITISPVYDPSGRLINFICIQNDITEKRNLESQLFHSQKLESIGQLAAGVAHEINNPIGFIISNQNTLKRYLASIKELLNLYDDMVKDRNESPTVLSSDLLQGIEIFKKEKKINYIMSDIEDIFNDNQEGLIRVRDIVKGLRTFARNDDSTMEAIDVNTVIESSIKMAWNELKYKGELIRNLSPVLPIYGNAGQLGQVFLNLLVNAAQAIPDQGIITVDTFMEENSIIIRISDTGIGIPEENLSKILDPFFTTKLVGQGTGLGLSISFEIVKQHQGNLQIESQIDKGTTFIISFPVLDI